MRLPFSPRVDVKRIYHVTQIKQNQTGGEGGGKLCVTLKGAVNAKVSSSTVIFDFIQTVP